MRYTRYEYKRYSKIKFLCSVIIIGSISMGGGLYVSRFIFDKNKENSTQTITNNTESVNKISNSNMNIVALQCGYYSTKENAENAVNQLSNYFTPFISESDGKFRVIAGIYKEDEVNEKFNQLKNEGIDVAKVKISISVDTDEDKKCIEIIDGVFTILNKLDEDDVKGIKTEDFKTWTQKIISKDDLNKSKKLKLINECINSFPDELDKSNRAQITANIYKTINENQISYLIKLLQQN